MKAPKIVEPDWKRQYFKEANARNAAVFAASKFCDVLDAVSRDETVPESVREMCRTEVEARMYPALRRLCAIPPC